VKKGTGVGFNLVSAILKFSFDKRYAILPWRLLLYTQTTVYPTWLLLNGADYFLMQMVCQRVLVAGEQQRSTPNPVDRRNALTLVNL
jgi:hypothetical protein